MKRNVCIVFGVAMIGFVCLVVSGGIGSSDSMVTKVSNSEAIFVLGGGYNGHQSVVSTTNCGQTSDGCTVKNGLLVTGTGPNRAVNENCGGSCSSLTVTTQSIFTE